MSGTDPNLYRRKKTRDDVEGGNTALDMSYNRQTGSLKVLTLDGTLTPKGDASALKPIETTGAIIAFFNPSAVPVYVAFGTTLAPAAPTGGVDGIAVPAGQYVTLAAPAGMVNYKSTASCFSYLVEDNTYLSKP